MSVVMNITILYPSPGNKPLYLSYPVRTKGISFILFNDFYFVKMRRCCNIVLKSAELNLKSLSTKPHSSTYSRFLHVSALWIPSLWEAHWNHWLTSEHCLPTSQGYCEECVSLHKVPTIDSSL